MTSKGGVATHQLTIQTVAVRTAQVCARVCVCVRVGVLHLELFTGKRQRNGEKHTDRKNKRLYVRRAAVRGGGGGAVGVAATKK